MRLATASSIVVLFLPIVVEGQEAASSQSVKPDTEIRSEMMSEYRFVPPGSKPAALPTSLQSDSPPLRESPENKGDVVKMAPFVVRESGSPNAAYQSIEQESPAKAPATVASKLGIGQHDFTVGRTHAFVVTVFYIPFLAGFSW